MTVSFTAVYRPVPEGYVASVEEFPGANAQGETLEEARRNLVNRPEKRASTVPRHRESNDLLCRKICKDLGIPTPARQPCVDAEREGEASGRRDRPREPRAPRPPSAPFDGPDGRLRQNGAGSRSAR